MSEARPFSAQLRRRALLADVKGNIVMALVSLGLVPWGLYFLLGKCEDCTGWNVGGILVGLGMEAGSAALAWYMLRGIRERAAPGGDALSEQLKPYGDPRALAGELDADFAGQSLRPKRLYLGKRWLVYSSGEPIVRRVDDLVWAYVEAVKVRLNGVIPLGTNYQLAVWERCGRGAALELKKAEAEGALAALSEAAPWMLVGFTEAVKESWNSDREDLLAFVAERRKKG